VDWQSRGILRGKNNTEPTTPHTSTKLTLP
jgi:hypothetical protein